MENFKKGDYVKYRGRIFGVVSDTWAFDGEEHVSIMTHNGMKPSSTGGPAAKMKKITKEQFVDWIKRNGHTSMYEYVQ